MGTQTRLSLILALAFCVAAAACSDRGAVADTSADPAAPFFGPAAKAAVLAERVPLVPPRPPQEIAPLPGLPAFPEVAPLTDDAARRREIWASSRFRCRAISTTKLRTCKLAPSPAGWSITFPIADLTCDEVVFDAAGDPAELRGCRSTWLRVPKTISLKRSRDGLVWSGSHAGWRWPGDGTSYCCPGVWIEAPSALR
ncbi:MAG: hypothetical protein M0R80_18025 [Proteobacteria bacterium]|jgi:hypothetical protein|nr:hypothetical protein [Pseudomonadota bacterium]